jgi:adenine-specific DNA-methyltransferase
LARCLIERAKTRTVSYAELTFDHAASSQKIAAIEPLVGQCGELLVVLFTIDSLSQAEDHLLIAAITDTGRMIDQNIARWFFSLPTTATKEISPATANPALQAEIERRQAAIRQSISERNGRVFEAEAIKLDHWADDLKLALEQEIKELDRQIKEAKRTARAAVSLEDKLAGQKQIKTLEAQRNAKRKSLFEAQDAIDQRREVLIAQIEAKLTQNASADTVMFFRWRLA